MENGTYEQTVTHLERELELKGLEAPDELPINNVSQQPTNTNADRPKPTCHHCKKPGHYRNQCRLLKKHREQTENNQNNPGSKTSDTNTTNPNSNVNNNNNNRNTETVTELKERQKLFTHPVRHVEKQTSPQRKIILEPMQPIDRLPGTEDQKDRIRSQKEPTKVTLMKLPRLQPKI